MTAKLAGMGMDADKLVFCSEDLLVYPQSGEVLIQGELVRLGMINMQVLMVLLEFGGEVVSRSDFLDRVWKNQTVSDDVLTRCISELRTILGRHSSSPLLIETLPKRGYRWVPAVRTQVDKQDLDPVTQTHVKQSRWRTISLMVSGGVMLLLLFTVVILWAIELSFKTELVKVALIPTHVNQPELGSMAAELDEMLRIRLLETDNLRFIARSATGTDPRQDFYQIAQEYHAKWIIESNIRRKNQEYHVSLNLVDVRTALVVYSLSRDINNEPAELEKICVSFLGEVAQFLP
jgi:DNA-binding winged helix-turn-helix (wHTH) protein/TolB-like protein